MHFIATNANNGGRFIIDPELHKCYAGLFHLQSFLALLWDERRVKFDSEIEEQLWRMVHRRSGMQPLEFKHVMKLGRYLSVEKITLFWFRIYLLTSGQIHMRTWAFSIAIRHMSLRLIIMREVIMCSRILESIILELIQSLCCVGLIMTPVSETTRLGLFCHRELWCLAWKIIATILIRCPETGGDATKQEISSLILRESQQARWGLQNFRSIDVGITIRHRWLWVQVKALHMTWYDFLQLCALLFARPSLAPNGSSLSRCSVMFCSSLVEIAMFRLLSQVLWVEMHICPEIVHKDRCSNTKRYSCSFRHCRSLSHVLPKWIQQAIYFV